MFGEAWAERFQEALLHMFPDADSRAAAIKGYAAFAMTSLRLQARFEMTGHYKAKTYAEAASEVYHNEAYMQAEYLPGLFLSHYLWPHHYRQIQFFETAFVDSMQVAGIDQFVEVGVGTGLYSRIALQRLASSSGRGVDISPSSQHFAQRQMDAFGFADRYSVDLEDVTTDTPDASADALICVEVLEHLEDPVSFLRALRRVLKPGGKAFVTAALNAAHTDHIYLYRHSGEVEAQIVEAGFVVEQFFVGQAYAPSRPGVPVPLAAAFVVY
ncbi:class I SAM-dependent methyltransferase [Sphingomonas sp. JC676]|uniref:class I SAM-dependent methyltransferase n=1 Tax=Sphingomonas sp. JC676 TaxID=2768065 RepID=UPI001657E6AD|nr:class I SAM-dependent methyltransferase [Sphingomonas sp. JC676]MBC9030954.1 class I SAM-dependent methyltransferase [Sphingomonas sp. JC676]